MKTDIAHVGDMRVTAAGDIATISGVANLKRALFHRLVTVPGTLVHRPLYGVGVGRYQNSLSSFVLQQSLASEIIDQFKLDPRVKSIESVSVVANDEQPELTKIKVLVIPVGYTDAAQMEFTPFNPGIGV